MKVKVAKWGNSLGVRLPRAAADAAGLKAGSEVEVTVEGRDLRLKQPQPPKSRTSYYRLEDLVAEMKRLGPENEPETVDWGRDRGSEIIDDEYSRGEITLDDILSGRLRDKELRNKERRETELPNKEPPERGKKGKDASRGR